MTELARFYIKEEETGKVKEVTLYDQAYINIEDIRLHKLALKFFKLLWTCLWRTNKLPRHKIFYTIKVNAEDIFQEHNANLAENGLPTIDTRKIFDDDNSNIPKYIG